MNEATIEYAERPTSITVICVFGLLNGLLTAPAIFSPVMEQLGRELAWIPPYFGLYTVIGLACMIGLWMMKKWAVYTYIGLAVFHQIILLLIHFWGVTGLLIPGVIIFFALKHVSKMS